MDKYLLWMRDIYGEYEWKVVLISSDINVLEEQIKSFYQVCSNNRYLFNITGEHYTIEDF